MDSLKLVQEQRPPLAFNGYHHHRHASASTSARKQSKHVDLLSLQSLDYSTPNSPSSFLLSTESLYSLSSDSMSLCSSAFNPCCSPTSINSSSTFNQCFSPTSLSSSSTLEHFDSEATFHEQLHRHPMDCPLLPTPVRLRPSDIHKVSSSTPHQ